MNTTLRKEVSENSASNPQANDSLITFYKAYPHCLPAMCADRSALGTLPTQAYQYCEAITTASAFGWYAFAAADLQFWFDGVDTYIANGDDWVPLKSQQLPDIDSWWNAHCPEHSRNMAPPFVTSLGIPGYVQIWSGLLIRTRADWSVLVRPLANIATSNRFQCFEGLVETDRFAPAPLFINIRLKTTNTAIEISHREPLFQVQPIHRQCYARATLQSQEHRTLSHASHESPGMSDLDWQNYRKTVRHSDPMVDDNTVGRYASQSRKRAKSAAS